MRLVVGDLTCLHILQVTATQSLKEESSDSHSMHQEDAFTTPCFKAIPNAFVAKRSNYAQHEYSPLPDTLSNIADEDAWLKMNKGYVADLDSIQMTPARKVQSFPFNDITPVSSFFCIYPTLYVFMVQFVV